LTASRTS
jgi:hypothetical protein